MDGGLVLALLAAVVGIGLMLGGADRGATMIGGMFSVPKLGWPPGVQEDDDVVWCWRREPDAPAGGCGDERPATPVADTPPTRPQAPVRAPR